MILRYNGISAISSFRKKKLLNEIKKKQPQITDISAEYIHFVDSDHELTKQNKRVLESLLTYDSPFVGNRTEKLFLVVPRPGTISPWSSKATSIAFNCGLKINRIERAIAYYLSTDGSIDKESVIPHLHDRMTEEVFYDLNSTKKLFSSEKPKELITIDVLNGKIDALNEANKKMGLALSYEEIEYLYKAYKDIGRNPTDLELMMFGVVNSEHCRHKIFNADWYIDNKKQAKSLFKMIKNTYENHSEGIISAYSDNSAILNGYKTKQLSVGQNGEYVDRDEESHPVIKVETHNHPTAIAPFPGAATGSGGEIRDENATGRGAKPKMGLTGFSVSNLRIPGFIQPWEKIDSGKPDTIASPLEIMIKAPLGGASFNNEFGRPNTVGYFRTFEENSRTIQNASWGYHKPIMIAGGLGSISDINKSKRKIPSGAKLVIIGGPSMLIGLAGGSASSMESGKADAELDYASVQRGNAEIQRRAHEVINKCASLGKTNPITSIHDVGAGGLSNALTELVHDSGLGAKIELRDIDSAEPGLSPMEIWCNEAQERYVLAVEDKDLKRFINICERERCPYSIAGETTAEQTLVINDSLFNNRPADIPLSLLFSGPPKITKKAVSKTNGTEKTDFSKISTDQALKRVLQVPSVGSKKFLITIGDRNVGGMTSRDQMVGPWQVPVSDAAVSASGFDSDKGEAMAMGERTPIATVNAPASARMAITEAITNIASTRIGKLSDIKLSANWMAASGYQDEDYSLFETVKVVGEQFCPELNLTIPVGKDSLSMRSIWQEGQKEKSVASPISLIISAFAPTLDINKTLTPQLVTDQKSKLIFIDLGEGNTRLGGSALAQAYSKISLQTPDINTPGLLVRFFDCIQELNKSNLLLAYHDRSDGGLITTLLEMSFAGKTGLNLDISSLPGSTPIEKLFNEEAGVVLQIPNSKKDKAYDILSRYIVGRFYELNGVNADNNIVIKDGNKEIINEKRSTLESIWAETSYRIQRIRDDESCAQEEYELIKDDDPGITPKVSFKNLKLTNNHKPKVAILREQGVNGQNEMAAAFKLAGFKPVDVHMHDLQNKKLSLSEFSGMAVCGGFSYGDVLGGGQGWAKNILYNDFLKKEFEQFFNDPETFSLGVCNGCQMLSGLKTLIPGAEHWPDFLKNKSEQFEARLTSVKINKSPSIFLKGMEGSVLPIPVAHGEGRAVFDNQKQLKNALSNSLVPMQFVDNRHQVTETYPLNPNGSVSAITALSSADGRALIMMPHPERAFLTHQFSWHPGTWPKESPWLRLFQNAREWLANH